MGNLNIDEVNEENNFILEEILDDSLADCSGFSLVDNSYEETEDL